MQKFESLNYHALKEASYPQVKLGEWLEDAPGNPRLKRFAMKGREIWKRRRGSAWFCMDCGEEAEQAGCYVCDDIPKATPQPTPTAEEDAEPTPASLKDETETMLPHAHPARIMIGALQVLNPEDPSPYAYLAGRVDLTELELAVDWFRDRPFDKFEET